MKLILDDRTSKGIVKDFDLSHVQGYSEPPYVYKTMMDMVDSDPVLSTAIDLTVDLCTYKGYSFIGEDDQVKEVSALFNDILDFDQVIDNIIYQLIIYGDAYMELRWNDKQTKIMELHPLETTSMVIDYNKNGEIQKFYQKVDGTNEIPFTVDEVIYFRYKWVGSSVYSKSPFQSLSRCYPTRVYANDYLTSIFRNMPPKLIYFLKNANDTQRKAFSENLFRAKTTPNSDIVISGEAFDSKLIQVAFDSGLMNVLSYIRNEVLTVTRVPPHWVGVLDGANRGIGENVVIPYETKIKKLQQKIESQINKQLMPKLGYEKVKFKFNAISLMDEKTVVNIMNFLKAQGFDSETIIDYARNHGINLRADAKIIEVEQTNQTLANQTAQSRARHDKNADKMTSNLDQRGVSEEGAEKAESEA